MELCIEARAGVTARLNLLCRNVEKNAKRQHTLDAYVATCIGTGLLDYVIQYASANPIRAPFIETALVKLSEDWWSAVLESYHTLVAHPVLQAVAHRRRLEAEVRSFISAISPQDGPEDMIEIYEDMADENNATHPTTQALLWSRLVWGLKEKEHLDVLMLAAATIPQYLSAICKSSSFSCFPTVRRGVLQIALGHELPLFGPLAVKRLQSDVDPVVRYDADQLSCSTELADKVWVGGSYRVKNSGATSEILVVWGCKGAEKLMLDYSILKFRNSLFQQASGDVDRRPEEVVTVIDDWQHAGDCHTEFSESVCRPGFLPASSIAWIAPRAMSSLWA